MTVFRAGGELCVVLLSYVRPLDEVDAQMAAHVAWLEQGFEQGVFLVAGRRTPRTARWAAATTASSTSASTPTGSREFIMHDEESRAV